MRRMGKDRPLYMISVAADLAGVHPQTLRIYERKELICPQRSSGNTRLYSEADVERLRFIQQLTQEEGVNLAGVIRIIELQREADRLAAEVAVMRRQLAAAKRIIVQQQEGATSTALVHVRSGMFARRSGFGRS